LLSTEKVNMYMFNKLKKSLSIFKNLGNITSHVKEFYVAIVKILTCLNVIQSEVNNTKLGKTLDKYLPVVIDSLETVKGIIEKYDNLIGLDVQATAQTLNISEDNLLYELSNTNKSLKTLL